MTDNILGGGVEEFTAAVLDCVGDFLNSAGEETFNPLIATGVFLKCLGLSFNLL